MGGGRPVLDADVSCALSVESPTFLPLALLFILRMYSPSRIDEPPLNPYDFVRIMPALASLLEGSDAPSAE